MMFFFLNGGTRVTGRIVAHESEKDEVLVGLPNGRERRVLLSDAVWPARDEILDILGLVPRLKVSGVINASPAFQSGLRPGDTILEYAGRPLPTMQAFRGITRENAEGATTIVVERQGRRLPPVVIRPEKHDERVVVGIAAGIDLMNPIVADVRSGSPAAAAGIAPADVFTGVNGANVDNWIELFSALEGLQGRELTISFERSDTAEKTARLGTLRGCEKFRRRSEGVSGRS
jgi:S1-C subfamily serine protease